MKTETFPPNSSIPKEISRVKFGIDPTSDKLHLGHLVPLRMVKTLKDMGHIIDIVLGTFSAQMGDPSEKDKMRPMLSDIETKANAESILVQVKRILGSDINIHFNHTWFEKITLPEMMNIISKFNVNHLLSRDSFQNRIKNNNSIGMHELLVPILQGLDSVELKSDIEIGGTDQLFNFMISREMQEKSGMKPEICIFAPIINGLDGRKMSKSLNNCIFINDTPEDVFGKTMSISDETMREWIEVFLNEPKNSHPFELKKELAFSITTEIWGTDLAIKARDHFSSVILSKNIPDDIQEIECSDIISIICLVRKSSKTVARNLLISNAVKVNGDNANLETLLKPGDVIKIGKLDFVKMA